MVYGSGQQTTGLPFDETLESHNDCSTRPLERNPCYLSLSRAYLFLEHISF